MSMKKKQREDEEEQREQDLATRRGMHKEVLRIQG